MSLSSMYSHSRTLHRKFGDTSNRRHMLENIRANLHAPGLLAEKQRLYPCKSSHCSHFQGNAEIIQCMVTVPDLMHHSDAWKSRSHDYRPSYLS